MNYLLNMHHFLILPASYLLLYTGISAWPFLTCACRPCDLLPFHTGHQDLACLFFQLRQKRMEKDTSTWCAKPATHASTSKPAIVLQPHASRVSFALLLRSRHRVGPTDFLLSIFPFYFLSKSRLTWGSVAERRENMQISKYIHS